MPLEPTARLMSTYAQAPPITSSLKQVMHEKPDVRGNQTQLAGDWTQDTKAVVTENKAKAVHQGVKMDGGEPPMAAPSVPNLNAHVMKQEMEDRMPRSAKLAQEAERGSSSASPHRSLVKDLIQSFDDRAFPPPPPEQPLPTPTNKLYPVAKLRQYALEKRIESAPYAAAEIRKWFKLPENADLDRGFRDWWKNNP